jgi:T-complex protein 1 subunit theta
VFADDGVNTVKAACVENKFVAGAGAVELSLACQLRAFADTVLGLDQYAIRKVFDALERV